MKKFWSVLMFAALVMAGFTLASCSDDDDDNATPTWFSQQYSGAYTAIDSVNIMGSTDPMWGAKTDSARTYIITAVSDSAIDVTVPAEGYDGLFYVNDVSMGSYTIRNIAWNADSLAFYKNYGKTPADVDSLYFVSKGMGRDQKFAFNENSSIKVWKGADGKLNIINKFQPGRMPFPIYVIFSGTKE